MKTPPRLDRLSALLAGMAPRVAVIQPEGPGRIIVGQASAEPGLLLYLVTTGKVDFGIPQQPCRTISAPALIVCRADTPHRLEAADALALSGLLCARAVMAGPAGPQLCHEFGEPLAVSLEGADASLSHAAQLIATELQMPRCGQPALLDRAGGILLIGLLRHLIAHPRSTGGLFSGLADPRIARALVAMHGRPQSGWTLETLAAEAGMSRTSFATTFRTVMHQTPGKYLGKLRLAIAQQAIQSGQGLKQAAQAAGYLNASALSRALSRTKPPPLTQSKNDN